MEHDITLCCKCQKYKISNKKYMLCSFCNYERTHDGMNVWEVNKIKQSNKPKPKPRDLSLAILRDPILISRTRLCKVIGCTNTVKGKTGYCTSHTIVKTKNKKRTQQKINQSEITIQLKELKNTTKQKHGTLCEGCGKHHSFLDYSHILSVGQRKDLELDPENKNLLCRSCHQDWESWDMEKIFNLNCVDYNLAYIRKSDEQTFWRYYFKCIDHQMFKEAKIMEKIDDEFKNKQ